jgi:hypothetical protein
MGILKKTELTSRLALRAFGVKEEKRIRSRQKPAPNSPTHASPFEILVGLGVRRTAARASPTLRSPANPFGILIAGLLFGLAQRRRWASVRRNFGAITVV